MRVINTLQCLWSYFLSLFGVVRVHHLPTFVSVEPANYCQLRCPECPVGQRVHANNKAKHMPLEVFSSLLEQVGKTAHTMQFYFQGEPLLHPQLPPMIASAHAVGLYTIVSTNAQALTAELADALVRSGLNRIIVSIDGFAQDSYAAYRVGGSLEKALAGLRYLSEARQRHHAHICIELQVLRLQTNENTSPLSRAGGYRIGIEDCTIIRLSTWTRVDAVQSSLFPLSKNERRHISLA